jgi:DNA modification methylase
MKTLILGDCLEEIKKLPPNSVDAVVTDPPYGLEFMGKEWDGANGFRRSLNPNDSGRESVFGRSSRTSPEYKTGHLFQEWCQAWAVEALQVLKPGGHMLVFGGSRTYHRMACAIEDAGFEIRDQIMWLYGSGFPKSRNLSDEWKGWGTALKPAHEPIVVARKPLIGTVAANVLKHGTGAINVDGCRVGTETGGWGGKAAGGNTWNETNNGLGKDGNPRPVLGRWPANIIHDGSEEVLEAFPDATRRQSAARFFYCAKASRKDREDGNMHPTVKPTELMRYLCKIVTPPKGVILDPFMGSGSTGKAALLEGFDFVGIEKNPEYFAIAEKRI